MYIRARASTVRAIDTVEEDDKLDLETPKESWNVIQLEILGAFLRKFFWGLTSRLAGWLTGIS